MTESLPSLDDRQVVFVSHANPEDNAFATWLTLRLTREGYRVWCDVVKLSGGRDFWRDVETAIRLKTRRFVFVTSRVSNSKQGTLQELAVASGIARQLKDDAFIIPVKIDDLPYSEHNIQIHRLHAIRFNAGWEQGLADLLKAFREDGVPNPEPAGPASVASWWNANRLNRSILKSKPETLWTNWFPLTGLPSHMWVWDLPEQCSVPTTLHFPTYRRGNRLFSFADGRDLVGDGATPLSGTEYRLALNLRRDPPLRSGLLRHEVVTAVKQLLGQAWERVAVAHGLPLYELSNRRKTVWFPSGLTPNDTVSFDGVDGKRARRDLCGYRTVKRITGEEYRRHWHFGLEAMPVLYPSPALALKSHVVFTLDGKTITGDAKSQHRARRSQCKDWWNDKWRDLTLAAVTYLTQGATTLSLPVSPETKLVMQWRPIKCESPRSYNDEDVRSIATEEISEDHEADNEETDEAPASEAATSAP